MRGPIFATLTILLLACTPAASNPTPTVPPAAGAPAVSGALAPAAAATYTAFAKLIDQANATGTPVPRGTTPPAPATTGPTAPAGFAAAKLGDAIKAPNWEFKVQSAQRAKDFNWVERGTLKATAKGEFVMVLLDVTNIGNQNFGLNAGTDFELYDGQNRKYSPETASEAAFAYTEWLKLQKRDRLCQQCPPGVVVPTGVLFDVAPGLTGLKLRIVQAKTDVALP